MFVVFDLDGTLSNQEHRQHYLEQEPKDWDAYFDACGDDAPYDDMIGLMDRHKEYGDHVEIWTGRRKDQLDKTLNWLNKNIASIDTLTGTRLRMRPVDDKRHDTELKGGWMREYGKPDLVYEDRNQMVKFWRDNGVRCLQVQEGDF